MAGSMKDIKLRIKSVESTMQIDTVAACEKAGIALL